MEEILSQKDSASGFVHKLNNHLALTIGYAELLLPKIIDPKLKKDLMKIIEEVKQASRVSKDLANFLK